MARRLTPNSILEKTDSARVRKEPEVKDGEVYPTYPLSKEGQRAWDRLCAELKELGVLSPTYADFITIAAGAIGDIEIATEDLNKRGHISITERGETKNPSWTIKTSAQTVAHKYLTAMGLTPTTIGKLVGFKEKEEEYDDLD